jgi:hypothetical protein
VGAKWSGRLYVANARQCGAYAGLCGAAACSPRRGCSAGGIEATTSTVLASARGYGLPNLVQKDWDGLSVLTEGRNGRMRCAGSAVTLIGGVVRAELADRAVRWSSGLLDPAVRLVGLLQSWGRGQHRSNGIGGDKSRWHRNLHLRVVRRNSGEARAELVDRGLGETLGVEAKLWQWFAGAWARCCGWSTAEQEHCAMEKGGPQQILARDCCDGQVRPQEVLRGI